MATSSDNTFRIRRAALDERIQSLLAGPEDPRKPFVISECDYGTLYNMAAHIWAGCANESSVCLCARDKAVVAAALLAALAGGPKLILPYAFDLHVLEELHRRTGYRCVVSDEARPVPKGVRCFIPDSTMGTWPPADMANSRELDEEWLRLFTGGSTGTPQMWTKTVRNLLAESLSIVTHYQVTRDDRVVATVVSHHIYGLLYSILAPLLASAVVAPETPSFPGEIETALRQRDASILISVPAHFRALKGHPVNAPWLRIAFSSAGMLAEEDAAAFNVSTGVPVVEVYGSTETGGIGERIRARGDLDFYPFDPIDVKIEGDRLKVRSDYLSPELTLQADGFFEIGDRVKAGANKRFELLGRADGIVKVGGQRVDLAVVCQTLKAHPAVKDVVTLSLTVGGSRENQIVALVEADADTVNPDELPMQTLAPYARPRIVRVVQKIPMTAAGKYDRKAIEAIFQS